MIERKKLKVLITSSSYLPNIGGIENSLYYLAKAGENDDVTIVASDNVDYVEDNDERPGLNCNIFRYHLPNNKNPIFRVFLNWKNALAAYRKVKKEGCDLVISRYHFNTIICYLAGLKNINFVVPGVVKYQDSTQLLDKNDQSLKRRLSYRYNLLLQYVALKVSDRVFVFSENMEQQVKSVYKNCKTIRTAPGVDTDKFYFTEEKTNKSVNLLTVSRLNAAKNIEMAIESLQFLPEEYHLTIVGDGPIKNQLEELAVYLKLIDRVHFEGAQTDVVKYYTQAHLFLLPSVYEPFGQTILEASSCGLPTVAFDSNIVNTATKDILGELGCYADELDSKNYANAIRQAYKDFYLNKERSRQELRDWMSKNYSWEALYKKLLR
ncbi:glycosyltransferase family 4 protein [Vibrio metschnikovii]|nr:glycosyltransferase family 4 protein [Vibrio metschnikovii]